MHCPYHGDETRSAGIQVEQGYFNCIRCERKASVAQVIKDKPKWNLPVSIGWRNGTAKPKEEITEAKVAGWHSALLSNAPRLDELMRRRGLNIGTIENFELGWDTDKFAYTIPIRDSHGEISNVRRYQLDPGESRRKIWSVEGMGSPRLWPLDQLEYASIIICEGELDAMITIQNGLPCITRTGAADVWDKEWSHLFVDKNVYLCNDRDEKGDVANAKLTTALRRYARRVTVIELPFEYDKKHGKDLTDYFLAGYTRKDFLELVRQATESYDKIEVPVQDQEPESVKINVMESFDASMSERKLMMPVTIVGKVQPTYLVPERVMYFCQEADLEEPKCKKCVLGNRKSEAYMFEIPAWAPEVIALMNVADEKLRPTLRKAAGVVVKCPEPREEIQSYRNVEELYVRPSLDELAAGDQDFTHRKVISTAPSYDILSNQSVMLTGTIRPHPKTQANEFQAWEIVRSDTGLDSFVLSNERRAYLEKKVQTTDPYGMLQKIAHDIASNYTFIHGREDFHMFADLVFHSVLEICLDGEKAEKGWLDAIAIGDTRTGKSAVSRAMLRLYGMGELTNCEAASFAGVVGGLDRPGDGRWVIKWGSIPVNDRRIVVLDEVSGLTLEQIASMSDMRWEGTAQLTKIKSEQARARTRLLWLGNPRNHSFEDVTYGVDAIKRLIGNKEDIARFDMAMGVFSSDVENSEINKQREPSKRKFMTQEAYKDLLMWAWTRTVDQVIWMPGSDEMIRDAATRLGSVYIEDPPLVVGANVRGKIARISAAFAARTFSTDDGARLLVHPYHVEAALRFIHEIYGHRKFGYEIVSKQKILDRKKAIKNLDEINRYLSEETGLKRFLITTPKFSRKSLAIMLNISEESAGMMISRLWDMGGLEIDDDRVKVSPVVMDELRGTLIGDG